MDKELTQALATLRRKIRQSGKQYRRDDDTSTSLFHPQKGFVHAYEIAQVEAALNEFEATVADTEANQSATAPKNQLLREARMLAEVHPSKDTRDFANAVIQYLSDSSRGADATIIDWFSVAPEQSARQSH